MDYACLTSLEPADFFHWFGQICRIPHGSFKEEKLLAFLTAFAEERELQYEADQTNNLLIRVPATAGYEEQPPFLLQAHLDMVWRKDPNVAFDFATQPIDLELCGNRLCAKGTTLGADNAVGMATMLALADGKYPHPELELLFTAAEEEGMIGIRAFDAAKLKARRMVNMDCGDSHVLCVTSAGSRTGTIRKEFDQSPLPQDLPVWTLSLTGGLGGHGGLAANKGRCCGANLLGDLLLNKDVWLCRIEADEAIIKQATAVIATAQPIAQLQQRFSELKTIYRETDPDWQLTVTATQSEQALSRADSADVLLALSAVRTGQFRADGTMPQVIMTSGRIVCAFLQDGRFQMDVSVRSACDADRDLLFDRYQALLERLGLQLEELSRYSGWQENPGSKLRKQFQAAHERLFGYPMEIERVHGGIEVGILLGKLPDMDAVGIAPTARGAHTTGEYLLIDEVMPYWQLLTAILAEKV